MATCIEIQVGTLADVVKPLLLKSTPALLSVGKRCMEEGYSFIWRAGKTPYLVDRSGVTHPLQVKDNVPYLLDGPEQYATRQSAAEKSAQAATVPSDDTLPVHPTCHGGSSSSAAPPPERP